MKGAVRLEFRKAVELDINGIMNIIRQAQDYFKEQGLISGKIIILILKQLVKILVINMDMPY